MSSDSGPVVFVHGIGMSHRAFHHVGQLVAETHDAISVDLPGFGGTPSPRRRLGIEGHAAALAAMLDERGVRRCAVVGQSMGTQIAIELARTRPALVTALVLIGPVVDDRRPGLWRQAIALLRDSLHETPRMNAIVLFDYLRSLPQFLRELRPMLTYPTLARLWEVPAPVLVVRGSKDMIARRDWAQRVTDASAGGTLVEPRGPHHVQEHSRAAVAAAITDFLRASAEEPPR